MPLLAQSKHSHLENKSPLNQRCVQRESSSKAFTILSSMLALALMLATAPTVLPAEAVDNDIRLNGIFRSTLVPAFAKDSRLAGGAANFVGDHRSHGQVPFP